MDLATAAQPLPARRPAARADRARRIRREAWNLAAIAVLWLTSASVVALWLSGGGLQALLDAPAGTLSSLGRITGLASANLLLYQVLLMARVPLFERGLGRDAITRMHRATGFWSFWLMVAHIVLITLGYAAAAGMAPLAQLWEMIWTFPGMLLATASTGLLVLVVVTSIRRARARLRYESWHLLHLYAYLGVALAVPHMLWTGTDLGAPPASTYWWLLWVAAAVSVVVFRIVLPIVRSLRLGLRVVAVERDGSRGVRVRVRGRGVQSIGARAGQFLVWRFLDGPGWMRGHPFSLAAPVDGDELVLAARVVGDGTERLTRMRPGTRVLVEGPYGRMTSDARTAPRLVMLGAGAGIVPLVAILEAEAGHAAAVLVSRDHAEHERVLDDRIRALVAERGLHHVALDGPRSRTGSTWLPASHGGWDGAELLVAASGRLHDADVFVCGPAPWMDAVLADLARAGVPRERIHTESFTH